ncbi:MAG: glycosyltransferase family 1 protein, partial [Candidatus Hydrogenedentes bacterium]|nr:glycosyltransferase family 1 protein [Candidatus Hydrogenedentota bacterium]
MSVRVVLNALQAGNRSGTGRYAAELARRLPGRADDIEVRVLWPKHVPLPPASIPDAFELVDARNPFMRVYADQFHARAYARRFNADLIHYPANIGPLLPADAGLATVLTIHDLTYFRHPEWYRRNRAADYRLATRLSVRRARTLIADSQATADDCRAFLGVSEDSVAVIPLGVGDEFHPADAEQQAAVRAWYHLPERFILYVGTLEPRKNLVRLIHAWERIADACPYDLVLAGRDGWKVKPIRAAVAGSLCAKRIHFPGFVANDDLPALISAARVFAWPSLYEGFGLPPLEAMACGTPVVTSNRSSLPEVVADAALQVDPEDVAALAAALLETATDDSLRARLIPDGQARA